MDKNSRLQKLLNMLSMAQRANKVVSGDFVVSKALQENTVKLLFLAEDASRETKEKYEGLAKNKGLDILYVPNKDLLGHCLGKEYRAIAGILDQGFAKALRKLYSEQKDTEVD